MHWSRSWLILWLLSGLFPNGFKCCAEFSLFQMRYRSVTNVAS
ncbi:hypothetical protein CIPAW_07G219600 [Carya illinoinensis]|uniref:Uncharacterized protein n=1 Tax=Carya illinoinensis TaxID=32201 RepID=A0A8T1Q5B8_CARIL|nr:hypothetical protein CIPAW_07G219600 [Carya illinoinensis]